MASTSAPYGLRPVNMLGGRPANQGVREYLITDNEAVAIMNGDPVVLLTTGYIQRFNTTVAATTETTTGTHLGVFIGCEYPDPTTGVPVFRNFYPGNIDISAGQKIKAYVVDDPDALFMVQADGAAAQAVLGSNMSLIQTVVGNATTGNSGLAVKASSSNTTAALPIRVVDFVQGPDSAPGDAYTDLIVRLNNHFHRATAGI